MQYIDLFNAFECWSVETKLTVKVKHADGRMIELLGRSALHVLREYGEYAVISFDLDHVYLMEV